MLKTIVLVKLYAQRRFPLSFVLSFFTICACNLIYIARQSHMHLHHNIAELLLLLQPALPHLENPTSYVSSILLLHTHTQPQNWIGAKGKSVHL
ncbi:hypothetical protein QN277_020711 [Acacia crassicarpa]|uniref:Uncharacterized protein n=1 Tax=Acacia crassicarpa TaxID=499986 RepID=A0AAE1JK99_9FABA|nr:hypothetical protein QN277_020711 [Acacia crassicarpa]